MAPTIAILSRDDTLDLDAGRFRTVAAALRARGLTPIACPYDEAREAQVRRTLATCAAALAWVNPMHEGRSRAGLDALLRDAARQGVLIGAHPDVTDRLGVKAVLASTRHLGWSGDAWFYPTAEALRSGLPARVAAGRRVLKQNRGQSGLGVWRIEALHAGRIRVVAANDRTRAVETGLDAFIAERCVEIDRVGGFVDQAFQPRLAEGMIRCYLVGARVAGFGWQKVRALLDPDDEPTPPRTYSGPSDPRFQALRRQLEDDWTPRLAQALGVALGDLPVLWDADFLFGPRDAAGNDTFVLCEINANSVSPMPDEAPAAIAQALCERLAGSS